MKRSWTILAVVSTAVIAFVVMSTGTRPPRHTDLINVAAEAQYRPLQARFAGFVYVPFRPVSRGGGDRSADPAVLSVASRLLNGCTTPDHSCAVAHLLTGSTANAVVILEELTRTSPRNPAYWSDLAAARHEHSRATGDALTLLKALAAGDEAIRLDEQSAEAHFNRALILQRLGFRSFAAEAAGALAEIDPRSPWTNEVRERVGTRPAASRRSRWRSALPSIEEATQAGNRSAVARAVTAFPGEARRWNESFYPSQWAETQDPRWIGIGRAIAEHLVDQRGDRLTLDSLDQIARAIAKRDTQLLRRLAEGHAAYKRGRLLVSARKPTEAEIALNEAERLLSAAKSPTAFFAACYRAGALTDSHRFEEAESVLEHLARTTPGEYLALQARVALELSRVKSRTRRAHDALAFAERAVMLYDRLGDVEETASVRTNIAALLTHVGRAPEAWRVWQRAFDDADSSGDPNVLEAVLNGAARDALVMDHFDAARSLYDLQINSPGASPVHRFDALLWRAFAIARAEETAGPRPDEVANLRAAAGELSDPALRADAEDKIRLIDAMTVRAADPVAAIRLLTQTVHYRQGRNQTLEAEALIERARAYRSGNHAQEAAEDFQKALDLIANQSTAAERTVLRDAWFATADDACGELFALQFAQKQYEAALATTDRCRSGDTAAFSRAALPAGTVLIEFVAEEARTILFVAQRERLDVFTSGTGEAGLQNLLGLITSATDEKRLRAALKQLTAVVLNPAWEVVRGAATVVIVPDRATSEIPFAALIPADSTRYLAETHRIVFAPGAGAHVANRKRPPVNRGAVTVIGDPAFNPLAVPGLERLPEASLEAEAVATLYPNSTLLIDRDATAARFTGRLADSDLVHVAAHALTNTADPGSSVLVLAPEGRHSGMTYLHEIANSALSHAPLVVLAGCRTGTGNGASGSLRSFAAAFLAAGSRGVLASTRDIRDDATRELSLRFHQALRAGKHPADALRDAQLSMLRSPEARLRDPRSWAVFHYYGD
jgi:CHAT domain-containing protein/predicted negative regulator of RcsB-dependent stress response